jgi:hypothetical protein
MLCQKHVCVSLSLYSTNNKKVSLVQSSIAMKICDDFGGSKDALYMLKPETVYPDKLAGNNTARSIVAHLPWLMPASLWNNAYK